MILSAYATAADRPPQYVIISFDGALHLEQWERSRDLARRTGARFTYFLSCVYLLSPETRPAYRGPGMAAGRTNVGSGYSRDDVRARLGHIWQARTEGHEIASHGCGHFDGGSWSANEWRTEFDEFRRILRDAWAINELEGEPSGWRRFAQSGISGFRAPYLATGPGLFEALEAEGFSYDASTVAAEPALPEHKQGLARFGLPLIPEGPARRKVIAMDYNLYVRHSDGEEQPTHAALFQRRAYDAFMAAFDEAYSGDRAPLQLGFHFTLMNEGAYWRALERFALNVCNKPDVRCVGYRQYLKETAPGPAGSHRRIDG